MNPYQWVAIVYWKTNSLSHFHRFWNLLLTGPDNAGSNPWIHFDFHSSSCKLRFCYKLNKSGLQPVSRPTEQILLFLQEFKYFRGKLTRKLNGCFLGKTSLSKKFKIHSGGGGALKFQNWFWKLCFKTCVPQVKI